MQTELFEQVAHARHGDPVTSHRAAASVTELTAKQEAVLRVFNNYKRLTDEQLATIYSTLPDFPAQSESGLRTRRSELVTRGKVKDSGERGLTAMGRQCIIWALA